MGNFWKKYLFGFFVISLALLSCDKPTLIEPIDFYPEKVMDHYLFDPEENVSKNIARGTALFLYQNKNIIRRAGGYIQMSSSSGGSEYYIESIYDTIRHLPSQIIIEHKDDLDAVTVAPNIRIINLVDGKMSTLVRTGNGLPGSPRDTTFFYYGSNGLVSHTKRTFGMSQWVRTYTFDDKANLMKILGICTNIITGATISTTEELFGGYDNTANPLRKLWLFSDTYNRSLSTNNFTTYSYKKWLSPSGLLALSVQKSMSLIYLPNGLADYSR